MGHWWCKFMNFILFSKPKDLIFMAAYFHATRYISIFAKHSNFFKA